MVKRLPPPSSFPPSFPSSQILTRTELTNYIRLCYHEFKPKQNNYSLFNSSTSPNPPTTPPSSLSSFSFLECPPLSFPSSDNIFLVSSFDGVNTARSVFFGGREDGKGDVIACGVDLEIRPNFTKVSFFSMFYFSIWSRITTRIIRILILDFSFFFFSFFSQGQPRNDVAIIQLSVRGITFIIDLYAARRMKRGRGGGGGGGREESVWEAVTKLVDDIFLCENIIKVSFFSVFLSFLFSCLFLSPNYPSPALY